MKKHFVTFLSPGTFVHEESERPISKWDPDKAAAMAHEIVERHGATPFGFYFTTRGRTLAQLDSHEVKRSGIYYLGGTLLTVDQVKKRTDRDYSTLIYNIEVNHWDRVIENKNSYSIVQPFQKDDTLLAWTPKPKPTTKTAQKQHDPHNHHRS